MMIGASEAATFKASEQKVAPGSRLYFYSDGVSDIDMPGGWMLNVSGLIELLADVANDEGSRVERILAQARALQGPPGLKDDFSLVEVKFG
jgi:serine phosphatase RsbU (regulator of sigma subunit)